jgi:hypothetical protein
MASFQPVKNIEIVSVADSGNLDNERVVLRARNACNLANYLVLDSTYVEGGGASELNRHVYWFPIWSVETGDYIILYSKRGRNRTFVDADGDKIHVFYWGLGRTVWNEDGDAITLLYASGLSVKRV